MKKDNETKKYKIKAIEKASITNRLNIDQFNYFIKNNIHFLGLSALAATASIYGFAQSFKNNRIFLSLLCGMLSIQFVATTIINAKEAIKTNMEKEKYINDTYELTMGKKYGKENN